MNNRLCRLSFNRGLMMMAGMEKRVFIDIIKALPADAKILDINHDYITNTLGVLVHSNTYEELQQGATIPEVLADIRVDADGNAVLIKLNYDKNYSTRLANNGCYHEWTSYLGLTDNYEYCKHCGINKP